MKQGKNQPVLIGLLLILILAGCATKTAKDSKPKVSATAEADHQAILKEAAEMQEAAKGVTFAPTK